MEFLDVVCHAYSHCEERRNHTKTLLQTNSIFFFIPTKEIRALAKRGSKSHPETMCIYMKFIFYYDEPQERIRAGAGETRFAKSILLGL